VVGERDFCLSPANVFDTNRSSTFRKEERNTMRMSCVLMLAASLTFTSSVIASAAEQPKIKDVSGLAEVDLEADEYYFDPAFLRGTPGQKLKLEIENESSTLHSFTIPEQKLDMDIPPKGKVVVEVTFPPSGVVRFFCRFHSELGMEGELMTGNATPRSPK
jgi:plastocyanin